MTIPTHPHRVLSTTGHRAHRTTRRADLTGTGSRRLPAPRRQRRLAAPRRPRPAPILALLAFLATLVGSGALPVSGTPPPAAAQATAETPLDLANRFPVVPGLVREVYDHRVPRGPVDVQVLRFNARNPSLTLEPELGGGDVPGLEAPHQATDRLAPSAVAAVNASFFSWQADPVGDPVGLVVSDGAYTSQPEGARTWRGAFGVSPAGDWFVGRPGYRGRLILPDGTTMPLSAVGRRPAGPTPERPDRTEATLLGPAFHPHTGTPPGTTEVVLRDFTVAPSTRAPARVASVGDSGDADIPAGGAVLAATGRYGERLGHLTPGQHVVVDLGISAGWENLRHAAQAGPLILEDGEITPAGSWENEGFNPEIHSAKDHPRTIFGLTGQGEVLLVTVDGRQPGDSVGLTMGESARLMQALGARNAVMMDGGGSTQMAVDDRIVNDPCCDRLGFRRVATNLVVHSTADTPHVRRLAGQTPYATAATIATEAWRDGADVAVLASGEAFADGLAGGPLADHLQAPLLLTRSDSLPEPTARALQELGTDRVVILGGTTAVSDGVAQGLRDLGLTLTRYFGPDRISTAVGVARNTTTSSDRAFLVGSHTFPDALSAAVPAALVDAPVLLTATDALSAPTAGTLEDLGVEEVVVVGGAAAVSEEVTTALKDRGLAVTRLAGPTRYETSAEVAHWAQEQAGATAQAAILTTGRDFPSALAGGPLAARERKALLLVDPLELEDSAGSHRLLHERDTRDGTILGPRSEVSTWVAIQLERIITR